MGLLEDMDQRAKKLSFIDLLVGECSAIFFGLIYSKANTNEHKHMVVDSPGCTMSRKTILCVLV